jgi:hypothetical protein
MDPVLAGIIACRTVLFLAEDIYVHMRQHRVALATTVTPAALAQLIPPETFASSRDYTLAKSSFHLAYGQMKLNSPIYFDLGSRCSTSRRFLCIWSLVGTPSRGV